MSVEPDALADTSVADLLVVAGHQHHHAVVDTVGNKGPGGTTGQARRAGIAGGAVYDALVGATAVEHRLNLMTRDRRAVETYRRLDVTFALLD